MKNRFLQKFLNAKHLSIKALASFVLVLYFACTFCACKPGSKMRDASTLVEKMGFGWNLGNTLEAIGGSWAKGLATETSWGQPKTTKAMIDGLAKSGIKTLRVPVTWHNHLIDDKYTVDPKWMTRVKEVVDWAYNNGMYVVINSHHDNYDFDTPIPQGAGFYYPSDENYEESARFLTALWTQICTTFNNDYGERLIFETMNEPRPKGTEFEWNFNENSFFCKKYLRALNRLNQVVVDTIRKSGGNNAERVIMVPGLAASVDSALAMDFMLPKDSAQNKLAVSVHMYTPYNFAMGSPGDVNFTDAHKKELDNIFKRLNTRFVSKGIPVIIGEMGATNKDNLQERIAWFDYFITTARSYGIKTCNVWDNGVWQIDEKQSASEKFAEHYGYYDRNKQMWIFPELLDAALTAMKK